MWSQVVVLFDPAIDFIIREQKYQQALHPRCFELGKQRADEKLQISAKIIRENSCSDPILLDEQCKDENVPESAKRVKGNNYSNPIILDF